MFAGSSASMSGATSHDAATGTECPPLRRPVVPCGIQRTSMLFRTMLKKAADQLTPEDVDALTYIHSLCKSGSERPAALEVFRLLEVRGVFSADRLEPLEEILEGINRHDVANTVVKDFKVEMKGVRRSDSDPLPWVNSRKPHVTVDTSDALLSSDSQPRSLPASSLTKEQKKALLRSLVTDPDLQPEVRSLVQDEGHRHIAGDPLQSLSPQDEGHRQIAGDPQQSLSPQDEGHRQIASDPLQSLSPQDEGHRQIAGDPQQSLSPQDEGHRQIANDPLQSLSPTSSVSSSGRGTMGHTESRASALSMRSSSFSSQEASLTCLPENSSEIGKETAPPSFQTQTSEEGFINVGLPSDTDRATPIGVAMKPRPPSNPPSCIKKRMEWSIDRVELGRRIVTHSNMAFVKGNFSLPASGIKFRFRKPVSLVLKVYPFGLGKDKKQSLTLEVVVECRSDDLKSIGKLNLTITLSMGNHEQFLSERTWRKDLKTFQIHDFLPHEIITHKQSKSLDIVAEAYITFD